MATVTRLLAELERIRAEFGGDHGAQKCRLLDGLAAAALPTADAVQRLHETLCFLRAHPDDQDVLDRVSTLLDTFDARRDLRRFRKALADSGIAGTAINYPFFAVTARWLSRRFPGALRVDWRESRGEGADLLGRRLDLLATWSETPGLDEVELGTREWVQRLAGPDTTDADFIINRTSLLGCSERERDLFYEQFELMLELQPTAATPSRSRALLPGRPTHFQTGPLDRRRPELKQALRHRAIERPCTEAEGERLVTLAREAMVLRHRDLDAFAYGDARDVRLFDCGDGLEFAVIGVRPERRLMLEAVYGYLTLKNGVPIGYVLTSSLFASSEIAYNVFDTWRGGEAALVYGRVLAVTRQLYGAETFTIYPYQLGGGGNSEGLQSGSWWFYQKLGFRAREPEVLAVMAQELDRMRRERGYRTPIATLAKIAEHNVYWSPGRQREDVIGIFPIGNIGLRITDYLAGRFGADRERGERVCADEAAKLCDVRDWKRWSDGEQLWWRRWAPLLLILPGVEQWTSAERKALAEVARAKGGRRESDYARKLDAHRKLRAALRKLAKAR
ncbi:MAG: hypothetical protein KDC98_10705 [Planctomycetes bacterium]|nr:hypothetical protein [Planctomycetota bacterium]